MNTNNQAIAEQPANKEIAPVYQHRCGYCGSTEPLIPYEQMFGPGTAGWDCCPDCGGV